MVNWLFLSADGLGQASVCRIGELAGAVVVGLDRRRQTNHTQGRGGE